MTQGARKRSATEPGIACEWVSLDGVVQARGALDLDRTGGGFQHSAALNTSTESPLSAVGAAATSSSGWAVVTGASSGLGREFVLALAERGHPVLAVARRGERLRSLAEEVRESGGRLESLVADLATSAGIETLLERARSLEVELLVNNAGVAGYGPFASALAVRDRGLVRLNVEAIVALTRGLLPVLLARGRGGVINVASQMAFQPMPYFAAYAARMAFVLSFSEALAEELRGTGVRVTAVAPGFISSEFTAVAGSQEPERRFPHLRPSAGRRVRPTRPRARPHGQGCRPLLRLPELRRAVRASGRPAPDDGAGAAAGAADGFGCS
jgi:uncharacterized protein